MKNKYFVKWVKNNIYVTPDLYKESRFPMLFRPKKMIIEDSTVLHFHVYKRTSKTELKKLEKEIIHNFLTANNLHDK